MKISQIKTSLYAALTLVALVLSVGCAYLVQNLDIFNSPFLFAFAILVELILLITTILCLLAALIRPLQILGSILISAWHGILTNPHIVRLEKSKSPFWIWFRRRLDLHSPSGLWLTIEAVIAIEFLTAFIRIMLDVVLKSSVTQIDQRVLHLVPSIRTPVQTEVFRAITFLAGWQSIVLLLIFASIVAWRKRQKLIILTFWVAFAVEETVALVVKQLVARARPDPTLHIIHENGFSFPSGHTLSATVMFGLIAYILIRSFRSALARLLIIVGYVSAVFLVGTSRIYLGVHYPSDVLASVALGGLILSITIYINEIVSRFYLSGKPGSQIQNLQMLLVPPLLVIVSVLVSSILIPIQPNTPKLQAVKIDNFNATTLKELSIYSESLTGARMEPINFIYLGTRQQIISLFTQHNWYQADPSTLSNTLRAISIGFQGGQYLSAPVTPSFLNSQPEDLAFEHPTDRNSLRQRHHTRLWRTSLVLPSGAQVWVATASYDVGVELAGKAKLPTHHIDPNVDAERTYIIRSLSLENYTYIQVADPQMGKNVSGDSFFTDGKAALTRL